MTTNNPMSQEQLDAIQARAEVAERGPWEVTNGGDNGTSTFIEGPDGDVLIRNMRGHGHLSEEYVWIEEPTAQFIAHAREDIPALLAEVDRLRALTAVTEDMVERAVLAYRRHSEVMNPREAGEYAACSECGWAFGWRDRLTDPPGAQRLHDHAIRAALEAALNPKENKS